MEQNKNTQNNSAYAFFPVITNVILALATGIWGVIVFRETGFSHYIPVILWVSSIFFGINALLLKSNSALRRSQREATTKLQEKNTLLREVHHRVKNNLQTVSSLLSLQSRSMQDKKMSSIIKSSQNRVVSMSMVHEMLYKREDYLSKVELQPYVKELTEYLLRSINGNENTVAMHLEIDNHKLSIDTVIPLGLIINETVTNALKYGIPEGQGGEIFISLKKKNQDTYEMYLGDNGVGYPVDIDPKTLPSMGLKLIHNLSRQLRGSIERDLEKKGTYYRLIFKEVIDEFNSVD